MCPSIGYQLMTRSRSHLAKGAVSSNFTIRKKQNMR
jgi:hypothetical protein